MFLQFPVVDEAEFPHGLRCMTCSRSIGVGQPYEARLTDVGADGSTYLELVCVYCNE